MAVDAGQGDVFRAAWKARYEASPLFGELLARLDVLWGISGLVVASALFGVVWGVGNQEVGWAVGESPITNVEEGEGKLTFRAL